MLRYNDSILRKLHFGAVISITLLQKVFIENSEAE